MEAIRDTRDTAAQEQPASEHTQIQPVRQPRTISVEQLEYHLFNPRRARDPLLDSAYQLWRDVWQSTWQEANVSTPMYSDEFTRQDEVAIMAMGGACIAVTCLRWLDLTQASAREDSYFKHWPEAAVEKLGRRRVCIGSNTAIDPTWRRALVEPRPGVPGDSVRLSYASLALSARRFVTSSADCLIALTRNDRAIDRILLALGSGAPLARIKICGNDTDVICLERHNTTIEAPVVGDLWQRRHHAW
ncbi:MAG: hypothetical protein RL033_5552 [Pseudomonadota bacterium]|jgi:hypothetical protein